jgi:hypothetical protein
MKAPMLLPRFIWVVLLLMTIGILLAILVMSGIVILGH